MKLLVRDYDDVILAYGNTMEKGIFEEADPVNEIIKVVCNESTIYYTTNGVSIHDGDISSIDLSEVYNEKYCYSEEKGVYENTKYIEPEPTIEEKVYDLEDYTAELLYQVCLLQLGTSDNDVSINKKGGE